jgi:hypothetical protein
LVGAELLWISGGLSSSQQSLELVGMVLNVL